MQVAVKLGNRSQLIIPKKLRDELGIGPGKEVLLQIVGGSLVVKPRPRSYSQYMRGLGKEIWSDIEATEYVKREREAWEDKE